MKQVLQDLRKGSLSVVDIPVPSHGNSEYLIKSSKSLISIGTERMLIEFGNANYLQKALQQPEKVKMVLEKIKNEGLASAYDAVSSKLNEPLQLGYCNVGTIEKSSNDLDLKKGTRVVSNGYHAEYVSVPANLVTKIPDGVDDITASFTIPSSIALQGIRLIKPSIGENIVVIGLGLIGLLAVQILKANGCNVLGIDFDSSKCDLAKDYGAETVKLADGVDPIKEAQKFSNNTGVDAVLITASTKSHDVISQAAKMSRKRGRLVLVGVVGLNINRSDFYEKELSFQVSCSYGPGRYDDDYELKGNDYPLPFVRWTEKRNFEAILKLMEDRLINVDNLVSGIFQISDTPTAYEKVSEGNALGLLIDYTENNEKCNDVSSLNKILINKSNKKLRSEEINIAFVGSGNYATRMLMPKFKEQNVNMHTVLSKGGVSASHFGKKFNFNYASTDFNDCLIDDINTLVIATRHNLHADQVISAIKKNKNIFVEKPLALNKNELDAIKNAYIEYDYSGIFTVGFNRRFSPHIKRIKNELDLNTSPKSFIFTMNAGHIPYDHWTQDPAVGGGRILGEACHYIDLMCYLSNSKIVSWQATKMATTFDNELNDDKSIISLNFEDGSVGVINYFANGGRSFPKERLEIFSEESVLQIDNFKSSKGFNRPKFKNFSTWSVEKGQKELISLFIDSIKNNKCSPINFEDLIEVSKISIEVAEHLRNS